MTTRHLLAGTALATTLMLAAGTAMAGFIDLGGYTGQVQIKFQNYENFTGSGTIAPSNGNYGVLSITSIVGGPGFNTTLWSSGSPGDGFLAGVFSGLHVDSVTAAGPLFIGNASGGHIDIYALSANFDATQGTGGYSAAGCLVNTQCYNGITNVGGDHVLSLDLVSGINSTDGSVDLTSVFNVTTSPFTGSSFGYLDIAGGSAAAQFGKDGFSTAFGARDMFLNSNFCVAGSAVACTPVGDWAFDSHDPVTAFVTGVPEPGSLAVLGSALLGMVGILRRRRNKKSA